MKFIRFDNKQTRSGRLVTDKFALTSEIWCPFIGNCNKCYNPSDILTIDEQLFPTKARCRLTQYMSNNKPDKFGIKFFLLADAKSISICAMAFHNWEKMKRDLQMYHCQNMLSCDLWKTTLTKVI